MGGPEDSISKGLWAHTVLLINAETEQTIGPIDQQYWIRDPKERGKKHDRKERDYEDKESYKWEQGSNNVESRLGETMRVIISVCDREADVFEYLTYKCTKGQRFVVRASHDRCLEGPERHLFEALEQAPVLGRYEVNVPQRGGRKKRKANMQVRSKTVVLK